MEMVKAHVGVQENNKSVETACAPAARPARALWKCMQETRKTEFKIDRSENITLYIDIIYEQGCYIRTVHGYLF